MKNEENYWQCVKSSVYYKHSLRQADWTKSVKLACKACKQYLENWLAYIFWLVLFNQRDWFSINVNSIEKNV